MKAEQLIVFSILTNFSVYIYNKAEDFSYVNVSIRLEYEYIQ